MGKSVGIDIAHHLKVCLLAEDAASSTPRCRTKAISPEPWRGCSRSSASSRVRTPRARHRNEGRHRIGLPDVIAAVAIESALGALSLNPAPWCRWAARTLVVYVLDAQGRIAGTYAATSAPRAPASSCASSSGG